MDNTLFRPGGGTGDIRILIPKNPEWDTDLYLYLYSEFGGHSGCAANSGFEEWGKEIPETATVAVLGFGLLMMVRPKLCSGG